MLATFALLGIGLAGCTADTPAGSTGSSSASAEVKQPEAPADLTGEWVQTNSESDDSYQAATITADSIEINWISDGGNTRALYWAGTYAAPTEAGSFTWESQNDTEQTDAAMLASSDPTKTFSYDNDVVSYEVSAMGITKTVELGRE